MAGAGRGALTLELGAEILEGEPGRGKFTTPLATLHKFQGWADQFLTTPEHGIEDVYLSLRCRTGAWRSAAVYHDFTAETGASDYGTELDLELLYSAAHGLELAAAAAFYDSRGFSTDVRKVWIWGRWEL
jgi:hypothetical protein